MPVNQAKLAKIAEASKEARLGGKVGGESALSCSSSWLARGGGCHV